MKSSQNSLTEATFLILLSLKDPKHGYNIIKEISEWTNGRVVLAAGTLYSALENMRKKGWIEPIKSDEARRKIYQLTDAGATVLAQDYERMLLNIQLYEQIDVGKRDNDV